MYRIEFADRRCCSLASNSGELKSKLAKLIKEEVRDIRRVFKSGVSDSVLEVYEKYLRR